MNLLCVINESNYYSTLYYYLCVELNTILDTLYIDIRRFDK